MRRAAYDAGMIPLTALLLLLAPDPARALDLPDGHPPLAEGVVLREGMRGQGEVYPYIEIRLAGEARGRDLTPSTLMMACPSITTGEQAIAAVRLFVAGPLVRDRAHAEKIIDTARKLEKDLKRTPIVDGPMTSWQSAPSGGADEVRVLEKMAKEAVVARERYARVVAPAKDLDTAFVFARLRLSPARIRQLWGEPARVVGSGRRIVAYDLAKGGAIVFDATDRERPVRDLSHVREAKAGGAPRTVLHRFAVAR